MNIMKNFELVMKVEEAKQPMRSTTESAGFDVFSPKRIHIPAKSDVSIVLPFAFGGDVHQDVKVRVFVRSSFGIKKKIRLVENQDPTVEGVELDLTSDTHTLTLFNDSDVEVVIEKDEHFIQLILSKQQPSKEKNSIETLTEKEAPSRTKGHMEIVVPNVYDYVLDEDVVFAPREQLTLSTGFRTVIESGTWTAIVPHEEVKGKVMLANAVGIIDKDYAYNETTHGNCFLGLVNLTDQELVLPKGTHLTRWFTEKYYTFENEIKTDKKRTGGVGHTSN